MANISGIKRNGARKCGFVPVVRPYTKHLPFAIICISRPSCRALVVCILCLATAVLSQAQSTHTTNQPNALQGDGMAVQAMESFLTAAGGRQNLQQFSDFTGQGTITYFSSSKPTHGFVTVRGRRDQRLVLLAKLEDGREIKWMVNRGTGKFQGAGGRVSATQPAVAMSLGALMFSGGRVVNMGQQGATFTSAGTELVGQTSALKIGVLLHREVGDYVAFHYIEQATGHLVKIAERAHLGRRVPLTAASSIHTSASSNSARSNAKTIPAVSDTDKSPAYLREFTYGDYRQVGSVQMPFSISESLNGQLLWQMQLTSIQPAAGMHDSDLSF